MLINNLFVNRSGAMKEAELCCWQILHRHSYWPMVELLDLRIQTITIPFAPLTRSTQALPFRLQYTQIHHDPAAVRLWPAISSLWWPKFELLPVLILRSASVRYHNTFPSILRRRTVKYISRSWLWRWLWTAWGQW